MVQFGQLVIGPPGSGKTTYCTQMKEFLTGIGRKVALVNLDPANDVLPYGADIDLTELIQIEDAMETNNLGPNGGMIFCMEYLIKEVDWLLKKLKEFPDHYFIIDCPGQIELYTHHNSINELVKTLEKTNIRLAAVFLSDSYLCRDPGTFISVLLTTLSAMLQVSLPHVNVLSKIDLMESMEPLHYSMNFYTDVMDLNYLVDQISDQPFFKKFKTLTSKIADIIERYSLISFVPLNIKKKEDMLKVLSLADRANGFAFGHDPNSDLRKQYVQAQFNE